jgi:hypothetical protein
VKRKEFIKYSAAIAVMIGGGLEVFSRQTAKSAGVPPDLQDFIYKGRHVEFVQLGPEHVMMSVDGRMLAHEALMQIGPARYSSHLLPFRDYNSARILAQSLIDNDKILWVL